MGGGGVVSRMLGALPGSSFVQGSGGSPARPVRVGLVTLAVAALALSALVPVAGAASKKVDSFFPLDGVASGEAGHFDDARDLDVNDPAVDDGNAGAFDGWIYVVDEDNH